MQSFAFGRYLLLGTTEVFVQKFLKPPVEGRRNGELARAFKRAGFALGEKFDELCGGERADYLALRKFECRCVFINQSQLDIVRTARCSKASHFTVHTVGERDASDFHFAFLEVRQVLATAIAWISARHHRLEHLIKCVRRPLWRDRVEAVPLDGLGDESLSMVAFDSANDCLFEAAGRGEVVDGGFGHG